MGDHSATRGTDLPGGAIVPGGWTVRRFETIDSTNRWVLEEARAGAPEGLVAVTDHQAAGRGRRGRSWDAPPGSSLLVSVLLRPGSWRPGSWRPGSSGRAITPDRLHLLTMAAGLALLEAVGAVAGVDAALKWPNDLVVGDRKLAGLLAEAEVSGTGEVRTVVLGVGCNVAQRAFPAHLAETATSCVLEAGHEVDREALLVSFLDALARRLATLDTVALDYRARLATLGRAVRVDLGDDIVEGTAVDVDSDGRIEVERPDGSRVAVAVGDVVHLRPA
jgi:BirA family biotin operon repressor/biotin-[acetyl-CoA-carboxylase] ligase